MAIAKGKEKQTAKNRIPSFEKFLEDAKKYGKKQSKTQLLSSLKAQIEEYEKRYRMPTVEFIPRYERGEFEMDDRYPNHELFAWSAAYETYQRISAEEDNREP